MASQPKATDETTVRVSLTLGGDRITADITIPAQAVALAELTPVFRGFAEVLIDHAVKAEAARGRTVSCRKGCGACCRQLVPISEVEARQIRDLVAALPEPRRAEIRARFTAARRRLEESGLLEKLLYPERFANEELAAATLGLPYFRLGIPCPFLEDESCMIHPERPIACREYLVTSPAEHCADPAQELIDGVPLPRKVSTAIQWIGMEPARRFVRWVPLTLALQWADAHPDDLGRRSGTDWLREFFTHLTGQTVAPPAPLADGAAAAT